MTIEALVECDAETLEKMTDEELLAHFSKYLIITRPEYAPKQKREEQKILIANPKLAQGMALAKQLGIEIPTFRGRKK